MLFAVWRILFGRGQNLSVIDKAVKTIRSSAREHTVESELRRQVLALGGLCEKVRLVGRRGFPDRLCLFPGNIIALVETKRPRGGRLSVHQQRYRDQLSTLGIAIEVIRNSEDIARFIRRHQQSKHLKKRKPRRG
jgi:hypothetical protein